jgi:hypothetical protein
MRLIKKANDIQYGRHRNEFHEIHEISERQGHRLEELRKNKLSVAKFVNNVSAQDEKQLD